VADYRFQIQLPLRHTDTFAGTPFVHGGVLLALTELALDSYDREAGIPYHRDVIRMQDSTEVRYLAPLRWDDGAVIRMRCTRLLPGRLTFECEVASEAEGRTVAEMTHNYAYVNAQSGRSEVPEDWSQITEAIREYEPDIEIDERAHA
jgi:acyl-CoA thioesterase FadM